MSVVLPFLIMFFSCEEGGFSPPVVPPPPFIFQVFFQGNASTVDVLLERGLDVGGSVSD